MKKFLLLVTIFWGLFYCAAIAQENEIETDTAYYDVELALQNAKHVRNLRLDYQSNFELFFSKINEFPNLQELSIDYPHPSIPEDFCKLSNLRKLTLLLADTLNQMPKNINKLKHLTELSLIGKPVWISNFCLNEIKKFSNIKKIYISSHGDSVNIDNLIKLKGLKSLSIYGAIEIPKLTNLKSLSIVCDGVIEIPKLTNLRSLHLEFYDTHRVIEIPKLTNLRSLSITSYTDSLWVLKTPKLPKLKQLHLDSRWPNCPTEFTHLSKLKELTLYIIEEKTLSSDCWDSESLATFKKLKNLKTLKFGIGGESFYYSDIEIKVMNINLHLHKCNVVNNSTPIITPVW